MSARALGGDAVEAGHRPDQRQGSPAVDPDTQRHGTWADRQIDGRTPERGFPICARPLPLIAVPRDGPTADVQRQWRPGRCRHAQGPDRVSLPRMSGQTGQQQACRDRDHGQDGC
ncbi:hypothetical protein P0F65_10465 [Sphingomonas sp. I4]